MKTRLPVALVTLALLFAGGPLLVPLQDAGPDRTYRDLADEDSRFAELAGLDVHHKVVGDGDPTLILLHHFYGNVATWRRLMAQLEGEATVAAFDRPAFGLTERPRREHWNGSNPYTRETSARITVELIDRLGRDQAVLVGSSAGGTAAIETYHRFPDRVRALVLMAPAITGDVGAPPPMRAALRAEQFRRLAPKVLSRFAGEITLERVTSGWADPSRADASDVAAYEQLLRVPDWELAMYELFVSEAPPNLSAVLPTIDVPTLVISGDRDRTIRPAWSRRTAQAIPGATYVELEGCGHTPQEECPDRTAEAIREFLAEL